MAKKIKLLIDELDGYEFSGFHGSDKTGVNNPFYGTFSVKYNRDDEIEITIDLIEIELDGKFEKLDSTTRLINFSYLEEQIIESGDHALWRDDSFEYNYNSL